MTEPNQVRPIMKIVNQVRELIETAYYTGKVKGVIESVDKAVASGKKQGIKEVVDWVGENFPYRMPVDGRYIDEGVWQAKLKEWGIE